MMRLKQIFYSTKVAVSILLIGIILPVFINLLSFSITIQMMAFFYFFLSTGLCIRWLMIIHTYEIEIKQKTQSEALRQSMAVNMTIAGKL